MRPAKSFVVNLIEFQSGEVTLVITGVPSQTVSSMQALEALGDLSLTSQCSLSEQSQDMECPESFMDQSDQSCDPGYHGNQRKILYRPSICIAITDLRYCQPS